MRKIISVLAVCLTLNGCSSMNSGFDCPNKAGVMCKNLDQINTMVDAGQIQGNSSFSGNSESKSSVNASNDDFQAFPTVAGYQPGEPIRYGETIQRIWVAPYEDSEGNYHQDSYTYSVMKNGHWIGHPVKAETAF